MLKTKSYEVTEDDVSYHNRDTSLIISEMNKPLCSQGNDNYCYMSSSKNMCNSKHLLLGNQGQRSITLSIAWKPRSKVYHFVSVDSVLDIIPGTSSWCLLTAELAFKTVLILVPSFYDSSGPGHEMLCLLAFLKMLVYCI